MRFSCALLFFVSLVSSCFPQTISLPGFRSKDYREFEDSLKKNIVYPAEAIRKEIEGVIHLEVSLDESYRIIPESVRVRSGLCGDCDAEAVRVVKKYRRASFKALLGPTYSPGAVHIVAIQFKISEKKVFVESPPEHQRVDQFYAVIKPKGLTDTKANPQWAVYTGPSMDKQIKTLAPGDTVIVSAYAQSTFYITSPFVEGYISYRSLGAHAKVDSLIRIIESLPPLEDKEKDSGKGLIVVTYDTLKPAEIQTARLSLTANKKSYAPGECAVVTLSFDVDTQNKFPIQFYQLGEQLFRQAHLFDTEACITLAEMIDNVSGVEKQGEKDTYTEYAIFRRTYCPTNTTTIKLPSFNLTLAVTDIGSPRSKSKARRFQSKPLTITLRSVPENVNVSTFHQFKMVGDYTMNESTNIEKVKAGEKFEYTVSISGSRLVALVEPRTLSVPDMDATLKEITVERSAAFPDLLTRKFVYNCISRKEGTIDLTGKIQYSFYDPATGSVETLRSTKKIVVAGKRSISHKLPVSPFFRKSMFIAVDVSKSMNIEDYQPYRLAAVREGILKFSQRNPMCDIQLILFAGVATHFFGIPSDTCRVTSEWTKDITPGVLPTGTAIGDVVWLASVSAKKNVPGKVVIIGDGDNTAGILEPGYAADIAKSKKIKVYTIGVGNNGLVPYGTDQSGKKNYIDNTFTDKIFKKISMSTGGQYQWAKDVEGVVTALEKFLRK